MPTARPSYDGFSDMPSGLRNFLLADDFTAVDDTLQKTYNLTPEQKSLLGDKFLDAVFNDTTLPQMLADLKAALVPANVPEVKWKEFEGDFLKTHAWPLRELFGDELTQVMSADGISTSSWPLFRVLMKPLSFSGAASEAASMAGFSLMAPQSRERLRDLLMSKSKGVRTDAQVREVLVRGADFGGLGLDAVAADKAIAAINQLLATAQIMPDEEYANWLAEDNRKKVQAMAASGVTPPPDDAEIAALKAAMPPPQVTTLDKAVEEAFNALSDKPADEYLARRLKYVISSRLRDIRTPLELKQLLARDSKVGGLGLPRDRVDALAAQIEDVYKKFHEPIMLEEKSKLDKQLEEQKLKIDERRKHEAEEHAQWYKDKVLARKEEEDQRSKLAAQMRSSFDAAGKPIPEVHPMDIKEQKTETARFGEMVPAVSAGATPVVPSAPTAGSPPSVAAMAGAPLQAARPEVKISKASADLRSAVPAGRPRLDDVAAYGGPQLTGPIRELKNLTLSEFRRLAKDPEIAAQKIMQRIETLGQESFDKRVEGIKAWQTSPLQQAYMQMVAASFAAGKPVAQLAEDKRQAGEDVPSPAELSAIITFNSKLHF